MNSKASIHALSFNIKAKEKKKQLMIDDNFTNHIYIYSVTGKSDLSTKVTASLILVLEKFLKIRTHS